MIDELILKKCQQIQLGLLKDFDKVCRSRGWTYWLDGGTLLGAVRHKGFIPWDDDIDVVMPRRDFEEFRKDGQVLLPEHIFLQDYTTERFDEFLFVKLRDKHSRLVEKKERGIKVPYHQGIFLDIFPIDTVKRGQEKRILRLFRVNAFFTFIAKCVFVPKGARWKRRLAQIAMLPLSLLLNAIFWDTYNFMLFVHKLIFKRYSKKYCTEATDALYFKPFMCLNFPRIWLEKEELFPTGTIAFEDGVFPAPANVDKYLRLQYGDYMQLPPPDKRVSHSAAIVPCID